MTISLTSIISFAVSILAPIASCVQLLPQLYKTYSTKSVKDLSLYTLSLILITNLLWLFHGYYTTDYSLVVSGAVSVIVNVVLLTLYFIYKKP